MVRIAMLQSATKSLELWTLELQSASSGRLLSHAAGCSANGPPHSIVQCRWTAAGRLGVRFG